MKWEKHESGDMSKWCSEVCGMGETPTPWLTRRPSWAKADSAVLCWSHVCVCASMWQQTSPSTPHPHSLSPPSLARSLFTSTSAVPHFSLCRHGKHAYFLLFCLLALLQHPSVPLVCSPPPPAYVSPPPMGFVGQPGYLTIPAAVKGVERSDTTLLPWCRSASVLLYAFRLTLCFAG